MKKAKTRARAFSVLAAAILASTLSSYAGTATFDFSTDPRDNPQFIIGSNVSDPISGLDFYEGANGNPGGYIAITRSANSQYSQILFPDFDNGLVVKAFTFECDLRLGNPTGNAGRPADGFSINYARAGDGAVENLINNPGSTDTGRFAIPGAPEGGTTTGLSICFDTWSGNTWPSGETDIEGIIVRVDNATVLRYGMPTRNGGCTDITSLQTGPYDAAAEGDYKGLCWTKLKVELNESGELTVSYKNQVLLDKFSTGYAPSAGRLLLAGRTGGANQNNHIDNLKITTIPADTFIVGRPTGNAYGWTFTVSDSGPSVLDPASMVVKYDGVVVTPTLTKPAGGSITTVSYTDLSTRLAANSSHTLEVTAKDTRGTVVAVNSTYAIPAYILVPASYAVSGTPTTPGMKSSTHMIDETAVLGFTARTPGDANLTVNAEQQFAKGYIDKDTGKPYDNFATPAQSDILVVNWDQSGGDIDGTNPDNFNSVEPEANPVPNDQIPGVETWMANDNIVVETIAYVQLKKGINRMGVNSDDGFKLTVARGQPSVTGVTVGEFNGGRGASDSIFDFVVDQDGYYPMRLLWWEGDGGANCEWFSVDIATGVKTLINGAGASAVKAFRNGAGAATVKSVLPANGYQAGSDKKIYAELIDGSTTVVDGSVKLIVQGADVTGQATIVNGTTTTVSYVPSPTLPLSSTINWSLVWTESSTPPTTRTNNFTFRTGSIVNFPVAGTFTIEAEHFDNNGQPVAGITGSGYEGSEYDGLGAVHNVDYYQNENTLDSDLYRQGESPNVPMDSQTAAAPDLDTARPGFEVTTNYKIGWAGNGEWYNYTRTIPAGLYTAYAAHSIDPAGEVGGQIGLVTAGAGTANQTVKQFGETRGPAPGGWGNNGLVPLLDAAGAPAYFKLPGGKVTLRYTTRAGDFDWFTVVPASGIPPKVTSFPSPIDTSRRDTVAWTIENNSTSVQVSSIKVEINGADATSLFTVTATTDGATITAKPPGLPAGKHTYKITFSDGSKTYEYANTMNIGPLPAENVFVIEAEDWNYEGGKANPKKGTAGQDVDVMPYLGGAYNGLSAVVNVDYGTNDGNDSDEYRKGENPNKNVNDNLGGRWGKDRGTWEVTSNYKLGWVDTADWGNYTRTFPAASYEVWAALSYDGRGENQLRGTLGLVNDPASTAQVVTPVGSFSAPGSGGWGANNLVVMADDAGAKKVVSMGGVQTVRFTMDSGDFDYLVFVPVGPPVSEGPKFSGISVNANGSISIAWEGGGTLQAAPSVTGPWQDVAGATSPYTFTPSTSMMFGRIRQ